MYISLHDDTEIFQSSVKLAHKLNMLQLVCFNPVLFL
jgi:hypothetical protein